MIDQLRKLQIELRQAMDDAKAANADYDKSQEDGHKAEAAYETACSKAREIKAQIIDSLLKGELL
jgi:chromosome segregation ATPase